MSLDHSALRRLTSMTSAFKKVADGDADGAKDFMTALMEMAVSQASLTESSMPVELPSGCTSDECDWIATSMFDGGKLDESCLTSWEQDISILISSEYQKKIFFHFSKNSKKNFFQSKKFQKKIFPIKKKNGS